jgi:hypothetical protein
VQHQVWMGALCAAAAEDSTHTAAAVVTAEAQVTFEVAPSNRFFKMDVFDTSFLYEDEDSSDDDDDDDLDSGDDVEDCFDDLPECKAWANKGECNKNPAYMLEGCRKSCHVCK